MTSLDLGILTLFDGIFLLVIAISALLSTLRGLTREFLGVAGWFIGIGAAQLASPPLESWLSNYITIDELNEILAWVFPFIGAIIIWFILASLVSPGLSRAGLGTMDRWFGVIFGIIRGIVIMCLLYGGAVIFTQNEKALPDWVTESKSAAGIRYTIGAFSPVLPHNIREKLSDIDTQNLSEDAKEVLKNSPVSSGTEEADAQTGNVLDKLKLLDDEK
jgi:membrane protein required for colicin V production